MNKEVLITDTETTSFMKTPGVGSERVTARTGNGNSV
jgi:hypothetical protein